MSLSKFFSRVKMNLPENKQVWLAFTKTALPVILSSLIFSLNAFVDNFMAISQQGGNEALAHANAWTEIQLGIVSTTTIIGTSLFSQYVGKKEWDKVKEVINLRMLFALGIALFFAIPCISFPDFMIRLISSFDEGMSDNVRENSINYLRIIAISWIINAWAFTLQMIIREKNHGFISLLAAALTLVVNIVLNSIFIYVLKNNIEFLAYSTLISLFVEILFLTIWIWFNEKHLFINIFKIFQISRIIFSQFGKRMPSFLLFAIGSITVNLRFTLWNLGYPVGSIGENYLRISAATILGITGMFFNIFWTTFEALSATVAVYVGKELGNNNIEKAKKNAKELQGYHFIIGLIIGLIALIFAFTTKYMTFLSEGYIKDLEHYYSLNIDTLPPGTDINQIINEGRAIFLDNIRNTLIGIVVFIPLFVWFVSRDRIISVGGLTNIAALIESIGGLIQICWLIMIVLGLTKLDTAFAWSYFIFYISDIFKMIAYEIIYHKVNWAKNVTIENIH
ncbi:MAG: MATE family efflux transporter [Mycoplasma sp.]|nr:MATE family efflux transporter [Mycoplasma sp.]